MTWNISQRNSWLNTKITVNSNHIHQNRIIAVWLFILCSMVIAIVVLGGMTRLTHSGLSMVDWHPFTGWLPPLTEADWLRLFEDYKRYPQYKELNEGMPLDGFKSIFWLEYLHRLWGRCIGLVFLMPFIVFSIRGWVNKRLLLRLLVIFMLGVGQGVLGWYMVKSGLIDHPDVSQYRLAAHLGMTLIILGYMLWVAFDLCGLQRKLVSPYLAKTVAALPLLVLLTVVSGGFVAGLDAGLTYNTFPLMDGEWMPDGMYSSIPWWLNWFENIATVQFNHRLLAFITIGMIVVIRYVWRDNFPAVRTQIVMTALTIAALCQGGLGIITLLLVVPIPLAILHQFFAVVVFCLAIWSTFETRTS